MTTQFFYHISLVLHIVGLTLFAGITVVHFIVMKQFWKNYVNDKTKGLAIYEAMSKFERLPGLGAIILIISGVGMMALTKGVFGEQIWFRIKFALVLILIINSIVIGRRQLMKLKKVISQETQDKNSEAELLKIKSTIKLFHISQLIIFIVIFVLSVFKFN